MKAITVWQPWATLLGTGQKHNETRSWRTNYRGEILIHAAKTDHSGILHVEMGTDMAVIQAYLGHKNITTTQIYSKIAAQQMCQVVDKITLKRKEA